MYIKPESFFHFIITSEIFAIKTLKIVLDYIKLVREILAYDRNVFIMARLKR